MARAHTSLSIEILAMVGDSAEPVVLANLFTSFTHHNARKVVYDSVFRLVSQGLLAYIDPAKSRVVISEDGASLLLTKRPQRDGVWKLVIFDIPEKQRNVRTFLRNRLKVLGFRKWQASIWVSPYRLDARLEVELRELASKFFVRLIKTTNINFTDDIEALFNQKDI